MALPFHQQDTSPEDLQGDAAGSKKRDQDDLESGIHGPRVNTSVKDGEETGCYCECSKPVTRADQNIARGFLFLSIATTLAYIPSFQAFAGESIEFFVVLAAVMGSRPVARSNLGWQNMMFINVLLGKSSFLFMFRCGFGVSPLNIIH